MELTGIYNMDSLDGMRKIKDQSIDMVLSDWPYGTTKCHWDIPLPLEETWKELKRIVKPNGAIVLFSAQPFTTDLINSQRKLFRYEIIWEKTLPTGFLNARRMPLRTHENILVFYRKLPTYNPQMKKVERNDIGKVRTNGGKAQQYNEFRTEDWAYVETGERYPTSVMKFSNWNGALFGNTEKATKHPTQKPVKLCEELIKTYSNTGDLVLDNCIGSGTTAVACINTGRKYIGFEKDKEIFDTATDRVEQHKAQLNMFLDFEEERI